MKVFIALSLICWATTTAEKSCNLKRQKGEALCTHFEAQTLSLEQIIDLEEYEHGITTSIRRIEFRDSNITEIEKDTFKRFPSLSQLILSNISLEKIENKAFQGVRRLKLLDLSYNKVKNIHDDLFLTLNIIHLRLDGNPKLRKPTNGPFVKVHSLRSLSARFCEIEHLSGSSFSETPLLESLDLSHNLLEMLPVNIFQDLALDHLDLSFNKFKKINGMVLENVKGYPRLPNQVLLNGNPWVCDCQLYSLISWASQDRETHYPTTKWRRTRLAVETTCAAPDGKTGLSWMSYDEWNCI